MLPKRKPHPALILGLVFFAFLIPILLASWVYLRSDRFALSQQSHGAFLRGAPHISNLPYQDLQGQAHTFENFQGHWWLLYVAPEVCHDTCMQTITELAKIPPALSKDKSRVARMYVSSGVLPTAIADKDLHFAHIDSGDQLHYFYRYATKTSIKTDGGVFILDPQGYLVMYYPIPLDTHGLFKDLKRLLRLSQVG